MCEGCTFLATTDHARRWERNALLCKLTIFARLWGRIERDARSELWSHLTGVRILDLGVGIGRDFDLYPEQRVVAIDISRRMLEIASVAAAEHESAIGLAQMDIQSLGFQANQFDCVVSDVTLCCVPDLPVAVRELDRILTDDGQAVLLERVRSDHPAVAALHHAVSPVAERFGTYIDRDTPTVLEANGFDIEHAESVGHLGTSKLIVARPN